MTREEALAIVDAAFANMRPMSAAKPVDPEAIRETIARAAGIPVADVSAVRLSEDSATVYMRMAAYPERVTMSDAPPAFCPRCHGLGYTTEDPAPECPGIGYEETECSACEGSGEAAPEALAAAREGSS